MVHNANQRILYLQQQLTEARDRITEYESKLAVTAHHPTGNPGDDPDQPFELTGQKAEVRNTISAFALTYSPWPNMTALQFPHCPRNLDRLDSFSDTTIHPAMQLLQYKSGTSCR